ncbi:hypothetical protein VNI00_009984 [Paramarasmius palmivorus]|uniref:Uncharacterized protein n=1 Tax=Paramarasmius palmivorus TaxID=297713 RepID=A0AAW0CK32_9AGAR
MSSFDLNDDIDALNAQAIAYLQREFSPVDLELLSERAYYWTFHGQQEYFPKIPDDWLKDPVLPTVIVVGEDCSPPSSPQLKSVSVAESPKQDPGLASHGVLPSYNCYSYPTPEILRGMRATMQGSAESRRRKSPLSNKLSGDSLSVGNIDRAHSHSPRSPQRPRTTPKHPSPSSDIENSLPKALSRSVPEISLPLSDSTPRLESPNKHSTSSQAPENNHSHVSSNSTPSEIAFIFEDPGTSKASKATSRKTRSSKSGLASFDTNVSGPLARLGRRSVPSSSNSPISTLIPKNNASRSHPADSTSLDESGLLDDLLASESFRDFASQSPTPRNRYHLRKYSNKDLLRSLPLRSSTPRRKKGAAPSNANVTTSLPSRNRPVEEDPRLKSGVFPKPLAVTRQGPVQVHGGPQDSFMPDSPLTDLSSE